MEAATDFFTGLLNATAFFTGRITNVTNACVGVVVFLLALRWFRRPAHFPPGPRGIPLMGVIPLLGKRPEQFFARAARRFRSAIVAVKMGSVDNVVLNDLKSIHQGFVKNGERLSGRAGITVFEKASTGRGVLFVDDGPMWRSQRHFGIATLRGFGVGKRSMEDRLLEESAYLNDVIESHNGRPFDITHHLMNAVSNNICSVVFGKRFDYDHEMFRDLLLRATQVVTHPVHSVLLNMATLIPWLMHVPPFSISCNKFIYDCNVISKRVQQIVDEHKESFNENDIRDFIDKFLQEISRDQSGYFTNLQLIQYVRDLYMAGTETTTSTLKWVLLCLLHHPHKQTRLYQEICDVIGANGKASYAVKSRMPYTCAFIQEVYRYRTLIPLGLPHKANADITLDEFVIPKGTVVLANQWAVHNNPDVWTRPETFDPSRHLDPDGNFVPSSHVIPFSVGPRHCLGEQLARMEIFVFLVSMLQRFEFVPADGELPDIDGGNTGILFSPSPFSMVAKARDD